MQIQLVFDVADAESFSLQPLNLLEITYFITYCILQVRYTIQLNVADSAN